MLVADKRKEAKKLEKEGMEQPLSESTVEMTISVIEKHAATKADLENLATNESMTAGFDKQNESMTAGFDKLNESISKTNERASETDKSMAAGFDKQNESTSKTNERITRVEAKIDIIKWMIGIMLAMAGLVVGVVTLLLKFAGG